jgi:hypothetical protein
MVGDLHIKYIEIVEIHPYRRHWMLTLIDSQACPPVLKFSSICFFKVRETKFMNMSDITIGIVSGLVTSVIIFFAQVIYFKALQPWLEELLYRDLRVEGRWLVEYPEAKEFTEAVELKRQGHRVNGTIVVTGGPDHGRVYIVVGTFKNLILTLSFAGQDATRLDRGTYTVKTTKNGQNLLGFSTFYQDDEDAIICMKCNWTRD